MARRVSGHCGESRSSRLICSTHDGAVVDSHTGTIIGCLLLAGLPALFGFRSARNASRATRAAKVAATDSKFTWRLSGKYIIGADPAGVPLPELTQERRAELVKVAHKYAEQARVAVRNVRRDGMDQLKRMEKDGDISQDEHKHWSDEVQKVTDRHIESVKQLLEQKEKDILQV